MQEYVIMLICLEGGLYWIFNVEILTCLLFVCEI